MAKTATQESPAWMGGQARKVTLEPQVRRELELTGLGAQVVPGTLLLP